MRIILKQHTCMHMHTYFSTNRSLWLALLLPTQRNPHNYRADNDMRCRQNKTTGLDSPSCRCRGRYDCFQIFTHDFSVCTRIPPKKQIDLTATEDSKQMDQMEGESCHYFQGKRSQGRRKQTLPRDQRLPLE